jgi:hypothetical protein
MGNKIWAQKGTTFGLVLTVLLFSTTSSWGHDDSTQQILSVKEKNPKTAFLMTLVGTAVPLAALAAGAAGTGDLGGVGMAGLLVGPSLGYFYGGLFWRGLLGVGIRAIGEGIILIGGLGAWFEAWGWDHEKPDLKKWEGVVLVGAGIVLASAIWDLAAVKGAVNKRNLRARERALAFSPLINPRTKTVGITVRLSF